MRKTICASMLGAATLAVGSEALAWGLHAGETMGSGDNLAYMEAGWPDVSLGIQHGLSNSLDIGARFSLSYGVESTTNTAVGMGLRAPIRISLTKGNAISAYVHVDPGIKFAAFSPVFFGIQFPIGFEVGYHATKEATVSVGFDMPFNLNLTQAVIFVIPPMAGPSFEYHPTDRVSVGLNTRFGAIIGVGGSGRGALGSGAAFGFVTQAGFGYRL